MSTKLSWKLPIIFFYEKHSMRLNKSFSRIYRQLIGILCCVVYQLCEILEFNHINFNRSLLAFVWMSIFCFRIIGVIGLISPRPLKIYRLMIDVKLIHLTVLLFSVGLLLHNHSKSEISSAEIHKWGSFHPLERVIPRFFWATISRKWYRSSQRRS